MLCKPADQTNEEHSSVFSSFLGKERRTLECSLLNESLKMEYCVCIGNGNATSFRTNSSLQAHIASAQSKPSLYMCDGCLKPIVSEYGLLKHSQNSCGKGFRTAELDARIAGKLELSPSKESKVVSIRGKSEPVLDTQLQEEHPGSSNEQSADTSPNYHNPEGGSSDLPDQSSQMEPEPNIQIESETQDESGCHAENAVSSDYFEAFSDEDDVVVVEENFKHYGENKDQSKESIALGGNKKERENRGKSARPSRRQIARAQAIAAGILQVNPGGMSNPTEKIPNTFYKNYATNINNKSAVEHGIVVSGMNTEGIKEAKLCEMLIEYFDQFGEINQIVIIRNPITKEPNGTAQIRFATLDGKSKALKKKMHTIGISKCEVRNASGGKDGKWYYDENDKCWSKSGTTIIAVYAIFDDKQYLITFADRRITDTTGVSPNHLDFYKKCTERSLAQATARYNQMNNPLKKVQTLFKPMQLRLKGIIRRRFRNQVDVNTDEQKLFKFHVPYADRLPQTIFCAVGMAGLQIEELKTLPSEALPDGRSWGARFGERLFPHPQNRYNTMVYVCMCKEAGEMPDCIHALPKQNGIERENFVCVEVDDWMESIGSGGDFAKKLLNDEFGSSVRNNFLCDVKQEDLLNYVLKVYQKVSMFDDHTGQEVQAVILCEDETKNRLVNFGYPKDV
ncbi:hypothetical protein Ddc_07258 [Ditylenchus destructor]|nr:hypothetical protein Ddc_07258 [Ditylenchus destructor]